MREYYPLLITGAIIGVFSLGFLIAFLSVKDRKESFGFERHMKDGEIVRRLFKYAKPFWKNFLLAFLLMLCAIAYDIVSPIIVVSSPEWTEVTEEPSVKYEGSGLFCRISVLMNAGLTNPVNRSAAISTKIRSVMRHPWLFFFFGAAYAGAPAYWGCGC